MTNEQKTEAPERIYAYPDEMIDRTLDWSEGSWFNEDEQLYHREDGATEYTRTDLSQAARGAAVKRCADAAVSKLHIDDPADYQQGVLDAEEAILATAPEAVKAFKEHAARHKAELEAVLRKAAEVIGDPDFTQEDVDYVDNGHKWVLLEEAQDTILALIDQPSALDEAIAAAKAEGVREALAVFGELANERIDLHEGKAGPSATGRLGGEVRTLWSMFSERIDLLPTKQKDET